MAEGIAVISSWNGFDSPSVFTTYFVVGNSTPGNEKTGQVSVLFEEGMTLNQFQQSIATAVQIDWMRGTGGVPLKKVHVLEFKGINV